MYEDRVYPGFTSKSENEDDAELEEKGRLAKLLERLRENEARKEDLRAKECLYLETRDPALLDEFRDNREYPLVTLKERITEPHALFNQNNYLGRALDSRDLEERKQNIEELKMDALLFNPKAEIREVETTDGRTVLAIIGVDEKDFWAFHNKRLEERRLDRSIERDACGVQKIVTQHCQTTEPECQQAQSFPQAKRIVTSLGIL